MAAQSQWVIAGTAQRIAGWRCNHDDQQWQQWVTTDVARGDGDCGGLIMEGNKGGGAMDGGMALQSQ
jgi:hypothetical protein